MKLLAGTVLSMLLAVAVATTAGKIAQALLDQLVREFPMKK